MTESIQTRNELADDLADCYVRRHRQPGWGHEEEETAREQFRFELRGLANQAASRTLVEFSEDAMTEHISWNGANEAVRNRALALAEQILSSSGD